jgi:hypothetical protein
MFTAYCFCINPPTAEEWTAAFTGLLVAVTAALVWVTWRLWTNAQEQLAEHQRSFALANRPALRVSDPRIKAHPETLDTFVACAIVNEGKTNAFNLSIWAQVTIDNIPIRPPFTRFAKEFVVLDKAGIVIPISAEEYDSIISGQIPLSLRLELQYSDLEKKSRAFEYLCTYNSKIKSFTIERMLQEKDENPTVDIQDNGKPRKPGKSF